jgi:hypothetical protein
MDSEAAVIKSEMMRTRADLDRKLEALELRARDFMPHRYAQRHLPDHAIDRAIGGVLTLVGLRMAWKQLRNRNGRRQQLRAQLTAYGCW